MRWESPLVLDLSDYTGNVPVLFLPTVSKALTFGLRCYQEYLSKSLTEKCRTYNTDREKLIGSANTEISNLQNKISGTG
jgi:hypothetical protein